MPTCTSYRWKWTRKRKCVPLASVWSTKWRNPCTKTTHPHTGHLWSIEKPFCAHFLPEKEKETEVCHLTLRFPNRPRRKRLFQLHVYYKLSKVVFCPRMRFAPFRHFRDSGRDQNCKHRFGNYRELWGLKPCLRGRPNSRNKWGHRGKRFLERVLSMIMTFIGIPVRHPSPISLPRSPKIGGFRPWGVLFLFSPILAATVFISKQYASFRSQCQESNEESPNYTQNHHSVLSVCTD